MLEFLSTPLAKEVISVAILLIILAVGYYLVRRFRECIDDDRQTANDWLTNFREMHHEGDISEAEFRTIKTVLGQKLQEEIKDTEEGFTHVRTDALDHPDSADFAGQVSSVDSFWPGRPDAHLVP